MSYDKERIIVHVKKNEHSLEMKKFIFNPSVKFNEKCISEGVRNEVILFNY